jgi:hypothetical protein
MDEAKDKKDEIIKFIYTDRAGFGSIADTLKEARQKDPSITRQDVKDWIEANMDRKTDLKGYNSYIPPGPHYEYQIDLFQMSDLKGAQHKRFDKAMCAVDAFTKYMAVALISSKGQYDFLAGLMECIATLKGIPKTIYSDDEGSWNAPDVKKYLNQHHIHLIVTRSHAGMVESAIKTIKGMIYKRLELDTERPWYEILTDVTFTYNNKRVQRTIEMKPKDAIKPENAAEVKRNIIKHATFTRDYPEVKVGDTVRIYRKKKTMDKQQKSVWLDGRYTVQEIREVNGQNFYVTSWDPKKPLLRPYILKIG